MGTTNLDINQLKDGTDGELITWDSAGAPDTVAAGTADQVLTSNGAGAAPTFQDAGGGGGSDTAIDAATNGEIYYNGVASIQVATAGFDGAGFAGWGQSALDTASSVGNAGGYGIFVSNGNEARMHTHLPGFSTSSNRLNFGQSSEIIISCRWKQSSTGDDYFFGCGRSGEVFNNTATNDDCATFWWDGATLKSKTSNGTSSTTNTITGYTLTNWNTYKIVITNGTNVKFYINGTLEETHTTNIPNDGDFLTGYGCVSTGQTMYISPITYSIKMT